MRTIFLFIIISLLSISIGFADWKDKLPSSDNVPEYLQSISVTIHAGGAEGSGVLKSRGNRSWVWTAAHVVDGLRSTEEIIDSKTGTKKTIVRFRDASIVREEVQSGRRVGESRMDVKVIRFSKDEDLALLEVRKHNYTNASVIFYLDDSIPKIGTRLYHVGSLLGQMGSNSMTSGIISQIGRVLDNYEYDQSNVTAFPGSSGGGVYLENGAYIAMLVRGSGEQFNLVIPIRRIRKWADRANILWAIDDTIDVPTDEELSKLPIEDSGVNFRKDNVLLKDFPYMIR